MRTNKGHPEGHSTPKVAANDTLSTGMSYSERKPKGPTKECGHRKMYKNRTKKTGVFWCLMKHRIPRNIFIWICSWCFSLYSFCLVYFMNITTYVWFHFKNHLVGFDSPMGTQKGKKSHLVFRYLLIVCIKIFFFNYMIYNFTVYVMWHRMKVKSHSPNRAFNQNQESSGPHLKMKVSRAL